MLEFASELPAIGPGSLVSALGRTESSLQGGIVNQRARRQLPTPTVHEIRVGLRPDQIAMLIGMIKGPSYYNPRSNPDNCLSRRNLVLRKMGSSNLIGEELVSHAATSGFRLYLLNKAGEIIEKITPAD